MMDLALRDELQHWTVDLTLLPACADFVSNVIEDRYPGLEPPLHARWRHFVFGGRDLWQDIVARHTWPDARSRARAEFDLIVTSVLLDAGAGADWHFVDAAAGLNLGRSEGLALASLRWFQSGALSNDPAQPLRVDAAALCSLETGKLEQAFQSRPGNALLGTAGRASLLNRLGAHLQARPDLFASAGSPRPGGLVDVLSARAHGGRLPAAAILDTLLDAFGPIWQNRPRLAGVGLGDCWPHPALQGDAPRDRYVALHKLSQWLAYSLIEPLERMEISIAGIDELTGLAEYRNGGLFVDSNVLLPRDPSDFSRVHDVADPFVVGWRALTVSLLDRVAPLVRTRLGIPSDALPLARILEGGTWMAGRLTARQRRAGGIPPFQIVSDGTVF